TDGSIVSYEWDFGDGNFRDFTSTNGTAAHLFTETEVGVRICTARVTDNSYLSTKKSVTVIVHPESGGPVPQPPVARPIAWPIMGDSPLEVTLFCNSSYDPDGEIVKYEWDFEGDGQFDWQSATPSHLQHTFDAGTWNAVLRVTDENGLLDSKSITILAYNTSLHWTSEVVEQLVDGSELKFNNLDNLGIGAAVSPVTGELCLLYGVKDASFSSYKNRIRLAFQGGLAGADWRFEDYYIAVEPPAQPPAMNLPTRPAFFPDGRLVFGTYFVTGSEFRQAILVERDIDGSFSTFNMGGFNGDIHFGRDWLDVDAGGNAGWLYKDSPLTENFVFAEKIGEELSLSYPVFKKWGKGASTVIGDVRYSGGVPCILYLGDVTSIYKPSGEEWLDHDVAGGHYAYGKILSPVSEDVVHLQTGKIFPNNWISRYHHSGEDWLGRQIVFEENPDMTTPPFEVGESGGVWFYLVRGNFEDSKLALIIDYGSYFQIEPIAIREYIQAEKYGIAIDADMLYIGALDPINLTVTLFARDIPS
ncbi:MAG: hypothetical protein HRF49_03335, partial [bacterium]